MKLKLKYSAHGFQSVAEFFLERSVCEIPLVFLIMKIDAKNKEFSDLERNLAVGALGTTNQKDKVHYLSTLTENKLITWG